MNEKNNKIDRPEGKFAKNFKLIVDINSIPNGSDLGLFMKLADSGMVVYDSTKGKKPTLHLIGDTGDECIPSFIDIKGEEVSFDDVKAQWEDDEFWRKEMYKCRQSPLYFYTNYKSASPKPTQAEIDEFLESIGMAATDDSDTAAKSAKEINEATKAVREKFSASITLEALKTMKPVRDKIDQEYIDLTDELRELASETFECASDNDKKIKEKVMTAIMKTPTKFANYELKVFINNNNGRWDKSLIRATDLDVLLRLWKQIL